MLNASATKNITEPPMAAIQKKSICKASLKSDSPFYMPIFRIFRTLEKLRGSNGKFERLKY